MTTAQPAARPYARALWELAKERGQVDAVGRELELVAQAIAETPALRDLFVRPWVAATIKAAVAREVAERLGVSALMRDFVALVARQGRGDQLEGAATVYRELADQDLGRLRAQVRTAASRCSPDGSAPPCAPAVSRCGPSTAASSASGRP